MSPLWSAATRHAIAAQFNVPGVGFPRRHPPTPWRPTSRPSALTQSVEILLDNALVHGSGDVEVRVSVDDGGDVEIADP